MTAARLRRRCSAGALGVACLLLCGACDVIILEPDLDLGLDRGSPPAVLGDGGAADRSIVEDGPVADLALPPEPLFMPAELDFGDVEPYSTVQRSVSLVAGRSPLDIQTVGVGGPGFSLDARSPRAPLGLMPGEVVRWTIEFTPEIAGRQSAGELVVVTGDGIRRLPLVGRGAWSGPPCAAWSAEVDPAAPRFIEPGAALLLKAKPPATVALGDVGLEWDLVEGPLPRERAPLERFSEPELPEAGGPPDDPRSFAAVLLADKPGRYLFEATPILPLEADCAPEPSTIAVHACPCPERPMHIRVGWQRSANAPPGRAWVAPYVVGGSAGAWDDGLSVDVPALDWGRPGPLDDVRLDVSSGDTSGRIDAWVEAGRLESLLRLGIAIFNAPDSPRTAVDVTVEVHLDGRLWSRLQLFGVEAGRSFWDVAAVVHEAGETRLIGYDRVLEAEGGVLPDPDAPLAPGSSCDPWYGPLCVPHTRCRPGPGGARCRP